MHSNMCNISKWTNYNKPLSDGTQWLFLVCEYCRNNSTCLIFFLALINNHLAFRRSRQAGENPETYMYLNVLEKWKSIQSNYLLWGPYRWGFLFGVLGAGGIGSVRSTPIASSSLSLISRVTQPSFTLGVPSWCDLLRIVDSFRNIHIVNNLRILPSWGS